MTPEELQTYGRTQAEDAVRYHNPPLDEFTVRNIAEHIADAWNCGYLAGKLAEREKPK
jgi:hypothetical protein